MALKIYKDGQFREVTSLQQFKDGVWHSVATLTQYVGGLFVTLWSSIRSCFGKGYWDNNQPWDNDDAWSND